MKRTADHAALRQKLLDAAVEVIADCGIEGCTSKKIAAKSELNEAYIFRYFFDMKDLKKSAFFREEEYILATLRDACDKYKNELNPDEVKKAVFSDLWEILLKNKLKTLFILRYFLSTECRDDVLDTHLDNVIRYFLKDEEYSAAEKKARIESAAFLTVCQYAALIHRGLLENDASLKNKAIHQII